jgi:hypothetical protein
VPSLALPLRSFFSSFRKLTHGTVHKVTSSGRVAETWSGASAVMTKKLKDSGHNLINRDGMFVCPSLPSSPSLLPRAGACHLTSLSVGSGRFDLKLPSFVVDELRLPELLEPILTQLRQIMRTSSPPKLRTHNVVFAPVGSKAQSWHVDDSLRSRNNVHSYFTILIHLNPIDDKCGGTEIWSKSLKRSDMVPSLPLLPRPSPDLTSDRSALALVMPLCSTALSFIEDKRTSASLIDSFITRAFHAVLTPTTPTDRRERESREGRGGRTDT